MTDDNVIKFTGLTKLDLEPNDVLSAALDALEEVIIIGTTKDGNQYFATSSADGKNILWHLETAKFTLMDNVFSGDYDDE